MNIIAACIGNRIIYWDSIILAASAAVCFCLFMAYYSVNGGGTLSIIISVPVSFALSLLMSRIIYWYCHQEQFSGIKSALFSYSHGSFCIVGIIIGFLISAVILKTISAEKDMGLFLDCSAPGLSAGLVLVRLSSLFNSSCRGKIVISTEYLQRLPLASCVNTSSGITEYRLATFFLEAIAFGLIFVVVVIHFAVSYSENQGKKPKHGAVFETFIVLYGVIELISESTRYDAAFFTFNAFISVAQMASAVAVSILFTAYIIGMINKRGFRPADVILIIVYLLSVAGVGISEYLVQRHANWYASCYVCMGVCCILMAIITFWARGRFIRCSQVTDA